MAYWGMEVLYPMGAGEKRKVAGGGLTEEGGVAHLFLFSEIFLLSEASH